MSSKPAPEFSDQIVYHGTRVDMALRTVTMASGKHLVREVVLHPGAVIILPVLKDGRIVMIRNLRHTVDQWLWELPAGTLEPPEPPEFCARRELIEETGYQAGEIQPFGWFYTSPGILTEKMYAFIATDLTPGPQALEENETITVEPLPTDTIRAMMESNEIIDGKTIAVLLKYLMRRRAGV
ncbi:MAG: NUDIX hydrolase [Phycisphaerae bacterium]